MNFNMNPPTTNEAKYKTMLCKHFETSKGCAFKEKCQFAHGLGELRTASGMTGTTPLQGAQSQYSADSEKKGGNPTNFKIVKCKYWERDGTCRYGSLCTFAHGDTELRSKADNLMYSQMPPTYYDPNQMQGMNYQDPNMQMMMNPYAIGFDPNMMNMNPNMDYLQGFPPNMMNMYPNQYNPGSNNGSMSN